MREAIVFISHHRIKAGKLEGLEQYFREGVHSIEEDKPQTVVFHAYFDEGATEVSFVHVFPDADAMDLHMEGVADRTKEAYEFLDPRSFEIYGTPSEKVLAMMRQAAGGGIDLNIWPQPLGGFIRLASG